MKRIREAGVDYLVPDDVEEAAMKKYNARKAEAYAIYDKHLKVLGDAIEEAGAEYGKAVYRPEYVV